MKGFFQKKIVMIVEAVLLVTAAVGLTIGGVSFESITGIAKTGIAALAAVDGIITAIAALVNAKNNS